MTKEKLIKMNELANYIEKLEDMKLIFYSNCMSVNNSNIHIHAQLLDEKTFKEWKELNKEFLEKRIKELEEEFERM